MKIMAPASGSVKSTPDFGRWLKTSENSHLWFSWTVFRWVIWKWHTFFLPDPRAHIWLNVPLSFTSPCHCKWQRQRKWHFQFLETNKRNQPPCISRGPPRFPIFWRFRIYLSPSLKIIGMKIVCNAQWQLALLLRLLCMNHKAFYKP